MPKASSFAFPSQDALLEARFQLEHCATGSALERERRIGAAASRNGYFCRLMEGGVPA